MLVNEALMDKNSQPATELVLATDHFINKGRLLLCSVYVYYFESTNIIENYPMWQIIYQKYVKSSRCTVFLSATRNKADFKTIRLRKWCCISKRATVNWNWEFHLEISKKNQDPIHMIWRRPRCVQKFIKIFGWAYL